MVFIYYKDRQIAVHSRCWERNTRIENTKHVEQVKKIKKKRHFNRQTEVFLSLGKIAYDYIERLADSKQSLNKTIEMQLKLKDEYGEKILAICYG